MDIDSTVAAPAMMLIIAGGRDFTDYELMKRSLGELCTEHYVLENQITIISGDARGADKLGNKLAERNKIPLILYPANWNKHGRSAGYKRNVEMAKVATHLLAFWDGKSPGTNHMLNIAKSHNLTIKLVEY